MIGLIPHDFPFPDYEPETRAAVINTCIKMQQYFREHDNICVSVSGGSDSDCIIHLICTYFPEFRWKIDFVYVDTGLEYRATREHIAYLETRYNIEIKRLRGKSVVYVVKKYGVPILSKIKSHFLYHYIRGNPCGEKEIFSDHKMNSMQFTENQKKLALYLKNRGILVSKKCCELSKRKPLDDYHKQNCVDLTVTGERNAEQGIRTINQKTCFNDTKQIHKFMPLFWWNDNVKNDFKLHEKIRFSDCYEIYGMKRTGCVGCPYNIKISDDLLVIKKYEPNLYHACISVFGKSYYLTDKFNARKQKIDNEIINDIITIYPELAESEGGENTHD